MGLTSEDQVDIEVDTLAHEDLRRDGDVTGRKMNDEITEHPVSVSLREPLERSAPPVAQPPPVTKAQVNGVARIVAAAGPSGITTAVLLEALADVMSVSEVAQVVADLVASDSALWAGSTTRLLVDGEHAAVWCPVTQGLGIEAEPRRSRPRIWIDAFGEVEPGMWARARAMVRGVVEDFPGVSEVRERFHRQVECSWERAGDVAAKGQDGAQRCRDGRRAAQSPRRGQGRDCRPGCGGSTGMGSRLWRCALLAHVRPGSESVWHLHSGKGQRPRRREGPWGRAAIVKPDPGTGERPLLCQKFASAGVQKPARPLVSKPRDQPTEAEEGT